MSDGSIVDLEISQAWVFGEMQLGAEGLTLRDSKLAGVVSGEALRAAIGELDEANQQAFNTFVHQDVDTNGDGQADAYSLCLDFETEPVEVQNWF